jgi:hypothetical protein
MDRVVSIKNLSPYSAPYTVGVSGRTNLAMRGMGRPPGLGCGRKKGGSLDSRVRMKMRS